MDNSRAYRDALSKYPTGVTLVTILDGGSPRALTVNSFASVSLDPQLVLWSLAKDSLRYEPFRIAQQFAVNILAADQQALSVANSRDDDMVRTKTPWEAAPSGVPYIPDALARFDCRVHAIHDGGDHLIIVGRVEHFDQPREAEALVFHRSDYSSH